MEVKRMFTDKPKTPSGTGLSSMQLKEQEAGNTPASKPAGFNLSSLRSKIINNTEEPKMEAPGSEETELDVAEVLRRARMGNQQKSEEEKLAEDSSVEERKFKLESLGPKPIEEKKVGSAPERVDATFNGADTQKEVTPAEKPESASGANENKLRMEELHMNEDITRTVNTPEQSAPAFNLSSLEKKPAEEQEHSEPQEVEAVNTIPEDTTDEVQEQSASTPAPEVDHKEHPLQKGDSLRIASDDIDQGMFTVVPVADLLTNGVNTLSTLEGYMMRWIANAYAAKLKYPVDMFEAADRPGLRIYSVFTAGGRGNRSYLTVGCGNRVSAFLYDPKTQKITDASAEIRIDGQLAMIKDMAVAVYVTRNNKAVIV